MNLKQIRKELKLKQTDIARILNIHAVQISRVENGMQTLNSEQIILLCKALNVSADYLLGLVDNNIA